MMSRLCKFDLLIIALLFIGLFFITRFYKIGDGLLFINDMGRDLSVLYDWKATGKPPLLGPQTSALPFNQSAIYFYLLYPAFLITNMSAFSALYTNTFIYIALFGLSFFIAKTRQLRIIVLIVFGLMILQPETIRQNRFVWNPSFMPPLLLVALISLFRLHTDRVKTLLVIHAAAVAAAVSISFSIAPLFIALLLYIIFRFRWYAVWFFMLYGFFLGMLQLPTLAFEIRHDFLLTKAVLRGHYLPQPRIGFTEKLADLIRYGITGSSALWSNVWAGLWLLSLMALVITVVKERLANDRSISATIRFAVVFLTIITLIVTSVVKVRVEAHYIFSIVILGFFVIATLPKWFRLAGISAFTVYWTIPLFQGQPFIPAPRTAAQMEQCMAQVCAVEKQPMYESLQSNILSFHYGPEYQFLMKKTGCSIKKIEVEPTAASTMAVVVDQSDFELGKTDYYELSLFQPKTEARKYQCAGNIQVHILER